MFLQLLSWCASAAHNLLPAALALAPLQTPNNRTDSLLSAHDATVVGLGSDSCNKVLVTVGSDAALRTWDFRKQTLAGELPLGSAATHLALHTGSELAAVACVDRVVRLVDIEACRVVRRFSGHRYVVAVAEYCCRLRCRAALSSCSVAVAAAHQHCLDSQHVTHVMHMFSCCSQCLVAAPTASP
jgi:hypothetical protein